MLQSQRQVVYRDDLSDNGRGVGPYESGENTETDQEGHHGHHAQHLGQDEVIGGIDSHDFKGVDLLCDAHGADFGGDVGTDLPGQNQAHDGR